MKCILNNTERAVIERTPHKDRNKGGFQGFMVALQIKMSAANELELSPEDITKIGKYAKYDNGGYEGRLKAVFGRHLPDLFPGVTQSLF